MPSNRREVARRILSDPDARRKLMVKTIQATQAREGIETTEAQAEKAYYVVTEVDQIAFFGFGDYRRSREGLGEREELFVKSLRGENEGLRTNVTRGDFQFVEGSPLIYRNLSLVGPLFKQFPHLDPTYGRTRSGLNTTEIERFVRQRWEVTSSKRGWVLFAKGGDYSRFYTDWDLVIDWTDDGKEFKAIVAEKYGSASRFVKSENDYFKQGITWMQTTNLGINARLLPAKGIFGVASPALFLNNDNDLFAVLALMNSSMFDMLARCVANRNWGATAIGSLPTPKLQAETYTMLISSAQEIFNTKLKWDSGNEISAAFNAPWLLSELVDSTSSIPERLKQLLEFEAAENTTIQNLYAEINDRVFLLYGMTQYSRQIIDEQLGARPPEVVWSPLEGSDSDQKRMEHVWRLLSYLVKRVVAADEDGIVPFASTSGESPLLERIQREIEELFPYQAGTQTEAQIVNELRRRVKGYRRAESIAAWLEDAVFDYHVLLYERRPVIWHIASCPTGEGAAAFGALVDYHRFDRNGMAKLRGTYLRDAINHFRREAALASQEGRREDQLELQAKLEEATALDERLRFVQEGRHEGEEGDERDFRILTPWKSPQQRPVGWNPDIDDGVKVNIEPLQKAGVLRIAKVI